MDWEQRLAALWAAMDQHGDESFLAAMNVLVDELPNDSAIGAYEQASAFDSTGDAVSAIPLYRRALSLGLAEDRRRQAVIQLASSLRNVGAAAESVALLRAEQALVSDELDDAVSGFLALALADAGQPHQALSVALLALSGQMTRYRRSLSNYAREIGERRTDHEK